MKNRNLPVDDNWITPPDLYGMLNDRFKFDFDPCPYFEGEITPDRDGLLIEWGARNFVNPPYSRSLKEAFVKRGVEMKQSSIIKSVFLLPVSTSTKLFHDVIQPNAKAIEFLRGRVKFMKKDEQGNLYTPKNGGMHDSMIVIF